MKIWIIKIAIIVAGIMGGYLYYHFIGCRGGSCPIVSSPYLSMIYGGLIGLFIASLKTFKKSEKSDAAV
jgi:hypothetical protein